MGGGSQHDGVPFARPIKIFNLWGSISGSPAEGKYNLANES